MNTPEETLMLCIYVSSTDTVRHTPVHEAVAYAAWPAAPFTRD